MGKRKHERIESAAKVLALLNEAGRDFKRYRSLVMETSESLEIYESALLKLESLYRSQIRTTLAQDLEFRAAADALLAESEKDSVQPKSFLLDPHDSLDFRLLNEQETMSCFRFSQMEIRALSCYIKFPNVVLHNRHSGTVDNLTVWKVILRRLSSTSTYEQIARDFGCNETKIKTIFNLAIEYLAAKVYKKLYLDLGALTEENLKNSVDAIYRKVNERQRDKTGAAETANFDAKTVAQFIGGIDQPINRPTTIHDAYFGPKGYSLKYQCAVNAEGFFTHLSLAVGGSTQDTTMLQQSKLLDMMRTVKLFRRIPPPLYPIYGDKSYTDGLSDQMLSSLKIDKSHRLLQTTNDVLTSIDRTQHSDQSQESSDVDCSRANDHAAFVQNVLDNMISQGRDPAQMTEQEKEESNYVSASGRIGVEWDFSILENTFPFVVDKRSNDLYRSELSSQFIVSVFLLNLMNCFRPNQIAQYFKPEKKKSIEEYLDDIDLRPNHCELVSSKVNFGSKLRIFKNQYDTGTELQESDNCYIVINPPEGMSIEAREKRYSLLSEKTTMSDDVLTFHKIVSEFHKTTVLRIFDTHKSSSNNLQGTNPIQRRTNLALSDHDRMNDVSATTTAGSRLIREMIERFTPTQVQDFFSVVTDKDDGINYNYDDNKKFLEIYGLS
ncbi:uncharacterized protein CYBJADRAFT_171893 [Cyberlindnera jadinii NRRL Y-1542]|uniref:DDE Tnp4 domain-containing protein n=1 Tax=Cyberlindnera jadinii (strain ATCC 18201 / CBS 1600 / BCRC 20928 / JCM 3617 / NBRC 0987 / NRRL Y-1542) TaxID=983966 RepID=A0A1E4S5V9_CYBJN|nr:hypothetical protein CYBJADRAFT_171893 [Cyberlindnera jadinii NRRL Y-1542]ODV74885.1 hypothetical protein CYBJADRAFT_171893 [Cyberlindnera jadinii NRRL Y-1542]